MTTVIKTLKKFSELNLTRKEIYGNYGYQCKDSNCFINDSMVDLFDGVTEREFIENDSGHRVDHEDKAIYHYTYGVWGFSGRWFADNPWFEDSDYYL